ncbi:MAG: O-antigen ligase family protein [Selenomonadaceae bacterium]|nr:O-antigen ligase family protein [Selenomonadaceae bacterium]
MNRISVFVRRQRIKKLEIWTMRAILIETFFLALFPSIAAAAVLVGIVAWFFRLQIDNKFKLRSLSFDIPAAIFIICGAVSVFNSSARSFELIYNYCAIVGIYALSYILVGQNIRTSSQVKNFTKALAASAFFVVMGGFFQYIFGVDISDMKWVDGEAFPELRKRVFSTLENPNILAGYLDVMICLALGVFSKVTGHTKRIIFLVAIALLTACLAMTYSRGAFLTLAIIFAVYGILKDWRILIVFAILTGIIIYSDPTFTHRILSIFTTTNDSSEGLRIGIWVSTISMIADHPFIGAGWGAFKFVYPQYNYYLADTSITIYHAHNLYLQTAAEVGIVGALAYFWYFFGTMFASLEFGKNKTSKNLSEFKAKFYSRLADIFINSKFLQNLANAKSMAITRLSELCNKILDKFSFTPSEKEIRDSGKNDEDFNDVELVHHEEMKWGKRRDKKKDKSSDKKNDDDNNMDLQRFAERDIYAELHEKIYIEDSQIVEGMKFGIGLAFLSMALNGMSDDLLFNIQSSILMWQLGALSAVLNIISDEEKI